MKKPYRHFDVGYFVEKQLKKFVYKLLYKWLSTPIPENVGIVIHSITFQAANVDNQFRKAKRLS
ncbi:MAG: hypothetical protein IJN54_10890 [Lachnospiraceae bacterium]|nr:hypothetical protein [Lachnospiraceae bacterium]